LLNEHFLSKNWLGASKSFDKSDWTLVGLPYDGTCSYRPGSRFAPEQIRLASWGLETYSPYQNKDLDEIAFYDAGELDLPLGNRDASLNIIFVAVQKILAENKHWLGIGGEHLVTYPVIQAYFKKYPDLAVIHFDAHADLRDDYLGEKLSHATVMRRICDLLGAENLTQIGIRSGTKDEFEWMQVNNTQIMNKSEIPQILSKLANRPIFLSVDLDVLDPGVLSGTGTPEPGGMSFNELISWLLEFKSLNFVGADVVELSPNYDTSGVSTIVAAKIIREILLLAAHHI